jgi:RNA polymerase sigma-70 factor (ECF subfamily)
VSSFAHLLEKSMNNEKELVKKAASGDLDAFEKLVQLKKEKVFWISYQITGNDEDSKDISQMVFFRLWNILKRFRAEKNFNTWLYRITVNMSIDYLRAQKGRGETVALEELSGFLPKSQEAATRPYHQMELKDIQDIYNMLSRTLTPKQKAVFSLKEIEGFSTREISRIMRVSHSTVRNHLFQARQMMKKGLKKYFPEYVAEEE